MFQVVQSGHFLVYTVYDKHIFINNFIINKGDIFISTCLIPLSAPQLFLNQSWQE
jgi:hypothetical protein